MAEHTLSASALVRSEEPTPASSSTTDKTAAESILHQALRGDALPPPIHDIWWDAPKAGSFDAGIARVLGEQYCVDWTDWVRARGVSIETSLTDVTKALQEEVKHSYGFARYASMLASGILMAQEDGYSQEEQQQNAEHDLSTMAAVAFYAGWIMSDEHHHTKMNKRGLNGSCKRISNAEQGAPSPSSMAGAESETDRVAELADILRRKIELGRVDYKVFTASGYWSLGDFNAARRIVLIEQDPKDYIPYFEALDKGLDDDAAWKYVEQVQENGSESTGGAQ